MSDDYRADPAGNFASDAHRRVITAVPHADQKDDWRRINREQVPLTDERAIMAYIGWDDSPGADLSEDEVKEILKDLEADGDVRKVKDGWQLTAQGAKVANGPIADPPDDSKSGRRHGA